MLKKITVRTNSDIALVKYWGMKDTVNIIPANSNISMSLTGLQTVTTVQFDPALSADDITIDGDHLAIDVARGVKLFDQIRQRALAAGILHKPIYAKLVSQNNFPKSTGLSSSASGFAALTLAACHSLGWKLSNQEMCQLTRFGSGSACRSLFGGFIEWHTAENVTDSFAETIFPADHMDIRDLSVIVSVGHKDISSAEGHLRAYSSIFFPTRLQNIEKKLTAVRTALAKKDFEALGELTEAEALEFQSILFTSHPAILMLEPGSLQIMHRVQELRQKGIPVYFTMNTGFNIHVLTLPEFEEQVSQELAALSDVKEIIHSQVGQGPQFLQQHLF